MSMSLSDRITSYFTSATSTATPTNSTTDSVPLTKTLYTRDSNTTSAVFGDSHAWQSGSVSDTSYSELSIGQNMTTDDVEQEGRPPYLHVRTLAFLSLSVFLESFLGSKKALKYQVTKY
jgi:hypothetical protein